MRTRLVAGLVLLVVLGVGCSKGSSGGDDVDVTGSGRAPVTYDLLEFSIGAEFRAATSEKAAAGAKKASDAIAAVFRGAAVAAADLVAEPPSTFRSTSASYISGSSGYTVRIRDLPNAPATLGKALEAGKAAGAVVRWSRVYLKVTDTAAEIATARKDALDDAEGRAQALAQDASRNLGKVQQITVASEPAQPPLGYATSMLLERDLPGLAAFLKGAAGKQAVFLTLKVRYELR